MMVCVTSPPPQDSELSVLVAAIGVVRSQEDKQGRGPIGDRSTGQAREEEGWILKIS